MRLFANQSSLQFSSVSAKIVNKDNIRVFKTVRLFKSLLCIGNAAAAAKKRLYQFSRFGTIQHFLRLWASGFPPRAVFGLDPESGTSYFEKYFNHKIQITLLKSNSNTFLNYFGCERQSTKQNADFLAPLLMACVGGTGAPASLAHA